MRVATSKNKASKSKQDHPLVSVVILNWRGTEDTIKCVHSLKNSTYTNIELILVDNESSRESLSALEAIEFVPKKIIAHAKNLGFTGGEISAYKECSGDFIFLLNNDAVIDKNAISNAVNCIKKDNEIAVVGGRSYVLSDDDKRHTIQFYSYQIVDPITAEVITKQQDDNIVEPVSNISGASVLIRREAIEECGYFDPRFFAYYEETDLFARFRRSGWKIIYDPNVIIWHKHGASTRNKRYMYYYFMLKNQFLFAYKNFDKTSYKAFRKVYWRNFKRSLKIYLKNMRNLEPHDYVHKARVMSTLKNFATLPRTRLDRSLIFQKNKSFSINEALYHDAPVSASLLVDATKATEPDRKTLEKNLKKICQEQFQPAEIVVVSRKPVKVPDSTALMRIENVIDTGIFDMQPLDYFFMASNHDILVFGNDLLIKKDISNNTEAFSGFLRQLHTDMAANESAGAISIAQGNKQLTRKAYLDGKYSLLALKKEYLTHYLTDNTEVDTLSNSILERTLGESLSQCRPIEVLQNNVPFVGFEANPAARTTVPLLRKPLLWNLKRILIKFHLLLPLKLGLRLLSKFLRISKREAEEQDNAPEQIEYSKDIPVFINTRDRFEPLKTLLHWLEAMGHRRVMLIDNESVYPPLLKYFRDTPYQVVRLGRNGKHKAPWESMGIRFGSKGRPYILSDPDVLPDKDCPDDAIAYFCKLLNDYPEINKVGFGLHIDDLPDSFSQKSDVVQWESRFWDDSLLLEPNVYRADVDTTFALYRPRTWWFLNPSIRTTGKYMAKHEPWYQDSDNPSEDLVFYAARASHDVTTWSLGKLPKHHLRALKKEGFISELEEDVA